MIIKPPTNFREYISLKEELVDEEKAIDNNINVLEELIKDQKSRKSNLKINYSKSKLDRPAVIETAVRTSQLNEIVLAFEKEGYISAYYCEDNHQESFGLQKIYNVTNAKWIFPSDYPKRKLPKAFEMGPVVSFESGFNILDNDGKIFSSDIEYTLGITHTASLPVNISPFKKGYRQNKIIKLHSKSDLPRSLKQHIEHIDSFFKKICNGTLGIYVKSV